MIRAGQTALAALLTLVLALPVGAQELRMGVQAPFVVDPHWLFLGPNMAASRHIFDSLVGRDADARWMPSLAESWRQVDDRTWEFVLRQGVRFHDGTPFTAEDVKATIERIPNIAGNPGPFTPNIRTIVGVEIVGPYTIRLRTDRPNPTLPGQLTNVFVIPAHLAKEPGEASGTRVAIGTGPYRLTQFRYGEGMRLERNEEYWGEKPDYKTVQVRVITNDAAREAALLAGDIDLMENVPPDDVARLRANPDIYVFARPADRVVFLLPNTGADTLPLLTDKSGRKLPTNPLRDLRVRQAISAAIDRTALVDRVLSGQGVPSMQIVPEGFVGWSDVIVPKADPAAARRLLAESGYPDGFQLAIACTNDRYVYDARICQALAQMLSRAGLTTAVETMPGSMFMPRTRTGKNEMPLLLYAISLSSLRDVGYILALVAHSPDESGGFGDGNRGSFADPELDRMIEAAIVMRPPEREAALKAAQAETIRLLGMIPLYHEYTIAATRAGIVYKPRIDEQMVAMGARRDLLP
ncbi:MAG TPA: ABC transporter substrate-binding protein [Acetobacteraceae bacterium]|nr:ABC transporter substrate-binding protein [Acetobacteraceae bacterium]